MGWGFFVARAGDAVVIVDGIVFVVMIVVAVIGVVVIGFAVLHGIAGETSPTAFIDPNRALTLAPAAAFNA